MSRTRRSAAVTTCILAFTLTGCGSGSEGAAAGSSDSPSSSDSAAAPAAEASTGDAITAEGFTFNAPEGWEKGDASKLPSVNLLALAIDNDDDDGFADNVNVLEDPTIVGADTQRLEDGLTQALGNVASDITVSDPVTVDGDAAVVVLATYPQYKTVQHAVEHDGKGYIVTFSFSSEVPEKDRLDLAASVAASWQWAS